MNASVNPANETWQEIQRAVESLSARATQEISPQQFYGELVHSLANLTSATRCQVWQRETSPVQSSGNTDDASPGWVTIQSTRESNVKQGWLSHTPQQTDYARLVADAAKGSTQTLIAAGTALEHADELRLPHDALYQQVTTGEEVVAVVELVHGSEQSPSQREAARQLATVASEVASDFQRNWQLRQLRDREDRREKLDRFLDKIHRTYDLRRVAYAIVAEGRELIECDRVSLVLKRGKRNCRVLAVSGVQKPDRRSPTVLGIERLVKSEIHNNEPLWLQPPDGETEASPLTKYFAESNATYVGLLPLVSIADAKHKPERLGTLLVEVFDKESPTGDAPSDKAGYDNAVAANAVADNGLLTSRANWMVRHASNALSNAVHVNRLPLLSLSQWTDRNITRGRRVPWLMLLLITLLVALWFVAWIPTDFRIDARGELVPVTRESVYAPRAGTVVEFPRMAEDSSVWSNENRQPAKQGTTVAAGDVVVRLENADLDYELTSLLGEQSTVNQKLETIAKSIGQFSGGRDADSRSRYDELTTQSAELKVKQESIARRIRLVNKERERLSVKATIPGQILTWDVVSSLKLRPVQQGDLLLEVVDLDGPWEIDLYVRDRHVGYVKRAQQERNEPLAISFFHRSDPEQEYSASIKSMSMSTEIYPEYGSAVRVIGQIDQVEQIAQFRPGTTIIAKIDCGKKPLAYVLGYDLIHTIRMWMLF